MSLYFWCSSLKSCCSLSEVAPSRKITGALALYCSLTSSLSLEFAGAEVTMTTGWWWHTRSGSGDIRRLTLCLSITWNWSPDTRDNSSGMLTTWETSCLRSFMLFRIPFYRIILTLNTILNHERLRPFMHVSFIIVINQPVQWLIETFQCLQQKNYRHSITRQMSWFSCIFIHNWKAKITVNFQ